MADSLTNLNQELKEFARKRNWEQFHDPKNLSMAISAEAAELLEHFIWLTPEQSLQINPEKKQLVAYEMADILIFLIRLSERLDIDLIQACEQKMQINERRFPVNEVYGKADTEDRR